MHPHTGPTDFTMFVDASLQGCDGLDGVIVNNRTCVLSVLGDRWHPTELSIEARALEYSAERLTLNIQVQHNHAGGQHGPCQHHSPRRRPTTKFLANELINAGVVAFLSLMEDRNASFDLQYVGSRDNPADIPSRMFHGQSAGDGSRRCRITGACGRDSASAGPASRCKLPCFSSPSGPSDRLLLCGPCSPRGFFYPALP